MPPEGVIITNREIYDRLVDINGKLDEHLTRHEVLMETAQSKQSNRHVVWQVRAALFGGTLGMLGGILGAVKPW